ncbi:MAG: hypothetical protein KatS3mg077_2484 [Candidatus Binatia bacterium]|nr:MAG: hypothetical protein KatS3mg077_2484 [Candidatus Binatia bacterium]
MTQSKGGALQEPHVLPAPCAGSSRGRLVQLYGLRARRQGRDRNVCSPTPRTGWRPTARWCEYDQFEGQRTGSPGCLQRLGALAVELTPE